MCTSIRHNMLSAIPKPILYIETNASQASTRQRNKLNRDTGCASHDSTCHTLCFFCQQPLLNVNKNIGICAKALLAHILYTDLLLSQWCLHIMDVTLSEWHRLTNKCSVFEFGFSIWGTCPLPGLKFLNRGTVKEKCTKNPTVDIKIQKRYKNFYYLSGT